MKLQEIEKISAYLDGEHPQPQEIVSLIQSEVEYERVYSNFKVVSNFVKSGLNADNFLDSAEAELQKLWPKIDEKLEQQDKNLSTLLRETLGKLPEELETLDIWAQIDKKLNDSSFQQNTKTEASRPSAPLSPTVSKNLNNWELLLSDSLKLPKHFEEFDLWNSISQKLDSQYHPEIFTTDPSCLGFSDKEKYAIGLSEYLDGEISAAKAQMINDHLLECSDCRKHYIPFSKLRQALKFGFQVNTQIDIWKNIEVTLFPEETQQDVTQMKKAEGF